MTKKLKEIENDVAHNNLIQLLSSQTPEERQRLLQAIDRTLCHTLQLKAIDLPWINPNKHTYKWEKIMRNLRLVIGKIKFERHQKYRVIH